MTTQTMASNALMPMEAINGIRQCGPYCSSSGRANPMRAIPYTGGRESHAQQEGIKTAIGEKVPVRLQCKKQSVSLGSTARHCCRVEEVIRRASAPSTPAATGYSTSFFHWLTCEAFCGLAGADWCLYACCVFSAGTNFIIKRESSGSSGSSDERSCLQ